MSFNAKNLSYESNEPAFLQKLRNQHRSADPARHERPIARPRKQIKDGDDDDQPTYVVEDSQDTLSKEEYDALIKDARSETQKGRTSPPSSEAAQGAEDTINEVKGLEGDDMLAKQPIASIGGSNKRRLAKVVGEESVETVNKDEAVVQDREKSKGRKSKKVKLSFDQEAAEP